MSDGGEAPICLACVGDPHLRARLLTGASHATCDECGEDGAAVPLARLAEEIDGAFQDHFELTPYEQSPSAADIFVRIAGLDPDLAWRVEDYLREKLEVVAEREDRPNLYDYSTGFAPAGTPLFWQHARWDRFCAMLCTNGRYFNREAETWLDEVFAELERHRTLDSASVIREILPGAPDSHFYRGRVATDEAGLRKILAQPVLQIGPLPPGLGSAGRLNAAGISVFYGATDPATCVSEIRPPVGAHVVLARFDAQRPLRLLDCEALDRLALDASPFDPQFVEKRDRAHFLKTFSDQIARAVLPGEETLGYVPTQAVAEYLADRLDPPIDGLLYKSTQRGAAAGNVMLFHRSARVEAFPYHSHFLDLLIREIDVDSEDFDDGITLTVKEIGAPEPRDPLAALNPLSIATISEALPDSFAQPDFDDARPVTLRLAPETIAVEFIRATEYARDGRRVRTRGEWPTGEL